MNVVKNLIGAGIVAVVAAVGLSFGFVFVLMTAHESEKNPGSAGVAVGAAAVQARDAARVAGSGGGVPAGAKVVEVADQLAPAAWKVGAAAGWLDSWTGSKMKLVEHCSGKADRCIIIKGGKVKGAPVGWSRGNVITVDTAKAKSRGYSAADRKLLLVHELGHQFGLKHTTARNIMNPYEGRWKLVLSSGQKKTLGKR